MSAAVASSCAREGGVGLLAPGDEGELACAAPPGSALPASLNGRCPSPIAARSCREVTDYRYSFRATADDGAVTSVTHRPQGALVGRNTIVLDTSSGGPVRLRYQRPPRWPLDVRSALELQLAVRATNTNQHAWQIGGPRVVVEDLWGRRRTYEPAAGHLSTDGKSWTRLAIPIGGGSAATAPAQQWTASGDPLDLQHIIAVEVVADTWGAGFQLELDGLMFAASDSTCPFACPDGCHGRGTCESATLTCRCGLGSDGASCERCRDGFIAAAGGQCVLVADGEHAEWPNEVSSTNGDAWLGVHHDDVEVLRPRVLALHFANTQPRSAALAKLDEVRAGFREASRAGGQGAAQLEYEIGRFVDLRDGVEGRPPPPAGFVPNNSTLLPRRPSWQAGAWRLDYARLFSEGFARHYGVVDDDDPSRQLTLCELVESGRVHEVWLLLSGDVPDVSAAEVLEHKQRYDDVGNAIAGSFDGCAGNGCFDADVPMCARSIRIGVINVDRGPGCYLHSQGHGLEGAARRDDVPQLSDWFLPFAGFDLGARAGLPFGDLYGVACSGSPPEPGWGPGCVSYPSSDLARVHHGGAEHVVAPWDARCGSVHFPPNARSHYDYVNAAAARSTCGGFGRGEGEGLVGAGAWSELEALAPDCGGGFLVWWFRQMPAFGTAHAFSGGQRMRSVWPFLFY